MGILGDICELQGGGPDIVLEWCGAGTAVVPFPGPRRLGGRGLSMQPGGAHGEIETRVCWASLSASPRSRFPQS